MLRHPARWRSTPNSKGQQKPLRNRGATHTHTHHPQPPPPFFKIPTPSPSHPQDPKIPGLPAAVARFPAAPRLRCRSSAPSAARLARAAPLDPGDCKGCCWQTRRKRSRCSEDRNSSSEMMASQLAKSRVRFLGQGMRHGMNDPQKTMNVFVLYLGASGVLGTCKNLWAWCSLPATRGAPHFEKYSKGKHGKRPWVA